MKKTPRKPLSKAEKAHFAWIAGLPCVLGQMGWAHECEGRTTVSHFNGVAYKGMAQKANNFLTLPICEGHHLRGPNSIEGMGLHPWLAKYGSQEEMLALVEEMKTYIPIEAM